MQNELLMKNFVINLLKNKLPASYYYHNHAHTLYVTDKAIEIGLQENCNEKELALLRAAALWHDTGFINTYAGHEEESCKLAKKYLPGYGFFDEDINKINGMIMATKIRQCPQNKLEAIIADADLEYLGTNTVGEKANDLFKELQVLNPSLTEPAWNQLQISFLQTHHYFTAYCIENKEPFKMAYLNELIQAAG